MAIVSNEASDKYKSKLFDIYLQDDSNTMTSPYITVYKPSQSL